MAAIVEQYGHSLLKECFTLYDGLRNFNHGSFGTVPKVVMQAQRAFHDKQESCPELWFREWYAGDINKGRQIVAKLIAADIDDVVMVENASYAVNSIIQSFPFKVQPIIKRRYTATLYYALRVTSLLPGW
jgi:selenocysteine lyase/cysteine desulfurase